jgi:competence protein ComGC
MRKDIIQIDYSCLFLLHIGFKKNIINYVSIGVFMRIFKKFFERKVKNQKKKAFTLAEIMLATMLIGIISVVMIKTIKPKDFEDKNNGLMAHKAIESMNNVFSQVRQTETEMLPAAKYMLKNASGSYEFAVLSTSGNGALADATELAGLFGDYMKKDGDVIDFCTVTGSCSNTAIKGFKLPGDLYIGIEKFASISDCPAFYMPDLKNEPDNPETQIAAPKYFDGTTKQCWGKIHIDTNGPNGPNTLNKDYYVYGLDEYGIVASGS